MHLCSRFLYLFSLSIFSIYFPSGRLLFLIYAYFTYNFSISYLSITYFHNLILIKKKHTQIFIHYSLHPRSAALQHEYEQKSANRTNKSETVNITQHIVYSLCFLSSSIPLQFPIIFLRSNYISSLKLYIFPEPCLHLPSKCRPSSHLLSLTSDIPLDGQEMCRKSEEENIGGEYF